MKRTIVVAGSMAQKPGRAGHTWVFLQYLLGFRRLGWEVLFLDRLDGSMCQDRAGRPCGFSNSFNLNYFRKVMRDYGLEGSHALSIDGEFLVGRSRAEVLDCVRQSRLLINVMGYLNDVEILGLARRRVFLDIDPGFPQIWRDLDLADLLQGHDLFVTIGLNIGRPECAIPTCGVDWITTPQPIVLDHWRPTESATDAVISSVVSWRGPFGPIEHRGRTYGLRVHEFRKFASLPRRTGRRFELALDIHPSEKSDLALLADNGWRLVDPLEAAGEPERYRSYIQNSRAELMVAKNIYVDSNSGWFSDRSICYLASGKPVLAQDTGLRELHPSNQGILLFSTLEECLQAVEELDRDYNRHAMAARRLAEDLFDSDRVLSRLLDKLGED